jgi:hypothetical protein
VGLALQGQQVLNLRPREIGWMFAECSLVMILVQIFVLAPLLKRFGGGCGTGVSRDGCRHCAAAVGCPLEHDKTVMLRLVFCWGGTFKLLHLVSIQ